MEDVQRPNEFSELYHPVPFKIKQSKQLQKKASRKDESFIFKMVQNKKECETIHSQILFTSILFVERKINRPFLQGGSLCCCN